MTRLLYISLILFLPVHGLYAQQQGNVHVVADELTIPAGNDLFIPGDYEDRTGSTLFNGQPAKGSLSNEDTLYIGGHIVNHSPSHLNISDEGTITLNGDRLQRISGDEPVLFHNLFLDTDTVTLYQVIEVSDSLQLIAGRVNNDSIIGGIDLGNNGTLYGESDTHYIYGALGKIFLKNRALSGTLDNIGGIGLDLEVDGSLGTSTIERQNGQHAGAADGSIYRFYNIIPGSSGKLASARISYLEHEVGEVGEDSITFWLSDNAGVVWRKQETSRFPSMSETLGRSMTISQDATLLTLADSLCDEGPTVDLGADKAICEGTPVTLDAKNPGLFFLWNTGAESQTIETSTAGTYWVLVTDANGCVGTDTIDLVYKSYPEVDFEQNFECFGQESSFTNLSTIEEGGLTYHWDFGDTDLEKDTSNLENPVFTYNESGQYEVTLEVTSDFDCVAEETKTYVVHPLPEPAFTVDEVCEGRPSEFEDASTIEASIGEIDYVISEYDWDFGVTGQSGDVATITDPEYTYDAFGEYEVRLVLESNAGCIDSTKVTATVNPVPEAAFSAENVCYGNEINLVNNSTLAEGELTWIWDFGDGKTSTETAPEKQFETYGTYPVQLKATSGEGCVDSITTEVTAYDIPEPDFEVSDVCTGADIELVNQTTLNTGAAVNYRWTFGDGTSGTEETPSKSFSSPGKYTIKLQATTEFGCAKSVEKTVTIHPVPVADFNFQNVCAGNAMRFFNVSSIKSGFMSYSWDFGDGTTSSSKSPRHTYEQGGAYDVTLTVTSQNGCEDVISKTVTVYPRPVIDLQDEITTCAESFTLDAGNAGSRYLWSDNSTGQTLTVTRSGDYRVVVTSPEGCTAEKTVSVTLNSVFEPNLEPTAGGCDVVMLDAGNAGAQSYLWSTGEETRTIEVTTSGTYSVDIVDQNGCPGSQEIEVTVHDSPEVNLGDDREICEGETLMLDATVPNAAYEWNTGSTAPMLIVEETGTYEVTVTSAEGCTASDAVNVTVNPRPIADLGPDRNECGEVRLQAPEGASLITWNDGSSEAVRTFEESGTYILTVGNELGCESSDTVDIFIDPVPVVELPESVLICSGERVRLDAENTDNEVKWSTGATTSGIEVTSTGYYSVVVTNSLGCTASDTTFVEVEPKVEVDLGEDQTICVGNSVTLDAGEFPAGSTYQWSGLDQGALGTERSLVAAVQDTYVAEVTTPLGCQGRDSVRLNVAVDTVLADFLMVSNANVLDTILMINLSVPDSLDYLWTFGDGNQSTKEDDQHIYLQEGEFQVKLRVSNEFCESTKTKTITINDPTQGRSEKAAGDDGQSLIESPHLISKVKTFPNPTSGIFTLDLTLSGSGAVELMIADYSGQVLLRQRFDNLDLLKKNFDITRYASGIYLLRVATKDETKTLRILKNE